MKNKIIGFIIIPIIACAIGWCIIWLDKNTARTPEPTDTFQMIARHGE